MNYEYYTNQEKSILINFFIKEGKKCNIEFKNYLESFVTKYGKKMYDKHPLRRVKSILDELGNYEYESPLYIWENEKNDNLVTYVFSHPGFVMTTGKINLIFENCELMNLMEKSKIEEFKKSFHDCLNIIEKRLYEIAKRENKNFPKSYEEDFNNDCLFFKEHRLYLDKIFNYYILNKKLIFDESKVKVKKNKI